MCIHASIHPSFLFKQLLLRFSRAGAPNWIRDRLSCEGPPSLAPPSRAPALGGSLGGQVGRWAGGQVPISQAQTQRAYLALPLTLLLERLSLPCVYLFVNIFTTSLGFFGNFYISFQFSPFLFHSFFLAFFHSLEFSCHEPRNPNATCKYPSLAPEAPCYSFANSFTHQFIHSNILPSWVSFFY